MKKFYTMLASLAAAWMLSLSASAAGPYPVPYVSAMLNDADWTFLDLNNDGKKWGVASYPSASTWSGTGYTEGITYSYHSNNPADDWAISPAIQLEAGKEYKVKVWYKTGFSEEKAKVMMAESNQPESLLEGKELFKWEGKYNSGWNKYTNIFSVENTGDYYFGIYCYSDKDKYYAYATGFEVCENVFTPDKVSGLTAVTGTQDDARALQTVLNWTLPTTDNDGAALPEDATYDAVNIYRDGMLVATLDGTATTWIDNAATGLTPGYHTYQVSTVINGAESARNSVNAKYVGPLEAFALPYVVDFPNMNNEAFELFWTPVTGRNSTSTNNWAFNSTVAYGNRFTFSGGYNKVEDNWLISPQMKFTEAGVYRFKVTLAYANIYKSTIEVYLGEGSSIGGYTDLISTIKDVPSNATTYEIVFNVETPGEYGIALHNCSPSASSSTYYLTEFSVEKWQETPVQVADLATVVNDDATVTLSWTNPVKTNIDNDLASLTKVEVYCDNELAETLTDVTPGAAMTYVHTPATAGVHTYYVLAYNADGAADGTPVKVTTSWVGDETQALPYTTGFALSDVTAPLWSGFDANGDGFTWVRNSSNYMAMVYDKTGITKHDDYLLSPYFNLQAGYYNVTIKMSGTKMKTYPVGIVADKKNVVATWTQLASFKKESDFGETIVVPIKVEEAGHYAIAILNNMYSDNTSDKSEQLTGFTIEYVPVVPGVATDLTVTPAADQSLEAEISWTNPTGTNLNGVAAESLTKAEVLRAGEVIATITEGVNPGETMTWTDTTVPGAGEYVYSVKVYNENGCSTAKAPEVKSAWIGGGIDLPWTCADFTSGWTIHDVNADGGEDEVRKWFGKSDKLCISCASKVANDWAVSPRLTLKPGYTYELEIKSYIPNFSSIDLAESPFDVYVGSTTHYSDMTHKLGTVKTVKATPSAPHVDKFVIKAADENTPAVLADDEDNAIAVPAGVRTIGLHANDKAYHNVSGVSVSILKTPGTTGLENVTAANGMLMVNGWNVEMSDVAAHVTVTDLSGKMVLAADNVEAVSLAALTRGAYIVSAEINGSVYSVKVIK